MDAQELRNLQEAYLEVVMNEGKVNIDDKLSSGKTPRQKMKTKASNLDMDANIAGGVASSPSWRTSRAIRLGAKEQEGSLKKRAKKIREVERTQKEQVDLYDIILSHLLDEGYAETPEAAEVIMVNMSEDWRENIMEVSDRKVKAVRNAREKQWNNQFGKNRVQDPTDDMVNKVDKLIDQRNKRTGSNVKKTTMGQLSDKYRKG
jgi:hypothetical protein